MTETNLYAAKSHKNGGKFKRDEHYKYFCSHFTVATYVAKFDQYCSCNNSVSSKEVPSIYQSRKSNNKLTYCYWNDQMNKWYPKSLNNHEGLIHLEHKISLKTQPGIIQDGFVAIFLKTFWTRYNRYEPPGFVEEIVSLKRKDLQVSGFHFYNLNTYTSRSAYLLNCNICQ